MPRSDRTTRRAAARAAARNAAPTTERTAIDIATDAYRAARKAAIAEQNDDTEKAVLETFMTLIKAIKSDGQDAKAWELAKVYITLADGLGWEVEFTDESGNEYKGAAQLALIFGPGNDDAPADEDPTN
jgi:hypothetical protein